MKPSPVPPLKTAVLALGVLLALLSFWLWRAWPTSVPAPLFIPTLFLTAQVPAIWWRMNGATGILTGILAILVPLSVFEALLAASAVANRGLGGDLRGIEVALMLPTVALTAVAGGLVAFVVCKLVPRRP